MDQFLEVIEWSAGGFFILTIPLDLILVISKFFIRSQKFKKKRTYWFGSLFFMKMIALNIFEIIYLASTELERSERIVYTIIYLMAIPGLVGSFFIFKHVRKEWITFKNEQLVS